MKVNYVEMGTCRKPHGIKGGFQFHLYNSEQSNLGEKTKILLVPLDESSSLEKNGEIYSIKSISFNNKVICYLNEVSDRNQVESIIPFKIFLDRNEFTSIDDNEVYLSDLEGLEVRNQSGEKIGIIKTYYDHGATPVLVVEGTDGKRVELPFVKSFFPELDLESKFIVMIMPEEFWCLNEFGF